MMGPANLALRFCLELAALAGFAVFGWSLGDGAPGVLWAIALPVVAATLWGVFAVPGDPSRSGHAPVPVAGWLRLVLELAVLFGGAACWYGAGFVWPGALIGALVALHYAVGFQRIRWLLSR